MVLSLSLNNSLCLLKGVNFPNASPINEYTIKKTMEILSSFENQNGTNAYEALKVGVHIAKTQMEHLKHKNVEPIIIFLAGWFPNVGINNVSKIVENITKSNIFRVPIYGVGYGSRSQVLIRSLCYLNDGFPKEIIESYIASQDILKAMELIESSAYQNSTFNYLNLAKNVTEVSFSKGNQTYEIIKSGFFASELLNFCFHLDCKKKNFLFRYKFFII